MLVFYTTFPPTHGRVYIQLVLHSCRWGARQIETKVGHGSGKHELAHYVWSWNCQFSIERRYRLLLLASAASLYCLLIFVKALVTEDKPLSFRFEGPGPTACAADFDSRGESVIRFDESKLQDWQAWAGRNEIDRKGPFPIYIYIYWSKGSWIPPPWIQDSRLLSPQLYWRLQRAPSLFWRLQRRCLCEWSVAPQLFWRLQRRCLCEGAVSLQFRWRLQRRCLWDWSLLPPFHWRLQRRCVCHGAVAPQKRKRDQTRREKRVKRKKGHQRKRE